MPSAADEYLLYQTLLGTLPAGGLTDESRAAYVERIERYMLKAARESKEHTSWTFPDEDYEKALSGFVQRILGRVAGNPFLDDVQALGDTLAWFGALNSLSMTLIKYGSPGVPDLYQGNELTDLSLVDPDNRRPVDYGARAQWLERLSQIAHGPGEPAAVRALAAAPHDGGAKLWILSRLLEFRRDEPALFRDGAYAPLEATGSGASHVVAFQRTHEGKTLLIVAGRLFAGLATDAESQASIAASDCWLPLGAEVWRDTAVAMPGWPDGMRFRNLFTGEVLTVRDNALPMSDVFSNFPGAALVALDARE
jgi:(1->4)-alpha-D-glucan 1-alpha-D-glucosylmutase